MPSLSPRAGVEVCVPSLAAGWEPAEEARRGVIDRFEESDAVRDVAFCAAVNQDCSVCQSPMCPPAQADNTS